jgi:predicted 2-oxoglutarate/Fe(II)-dependent dioxygenase YbiX
MFYSFLGQAGRPVALILAASVGMPELPAFVRAFASHLDEAARLDSDILLLIHLLDPADPTCQDLHDTLLHRIAPEVRKAFQVDICHMDRLLIARYEAGKGYFRRHRDNGAPTVMFPQFALSLNLNTDEYHGGHLTFPEYSSHVYGPAAGGGIVFSASLLHEALPVTSGTRYVLLTFLHDAAAETRRLAELRRLPG